MSKTQSYRDILDVFITQRKLAAKRMEEETTSIKEKTSEVNSVEEAQQIAQQVAQTIQQTAHENIARAVTRCLEAIFEDPYEFSIRFDRKRGKTEATLVLSRNGKEYNDPLNEVGGGVIDVASLSLRLACVMLSKPMRDRVLVLDEPFRNVRGNANKQRLRSLLLSLAEDLGFQFILNVDADAYPEFALGSVIQLSD
jgi:hypothetical protein